MGNFEEAVSAAHSPPTSPPQTDAAAALAALRARRQQGGTTPAVPSVTRPDAPSVPPAVSAPAPSPSRHAAPATPPVAPVIAPPAAPVPTTPPPAPVPSAPATTAAPFLAQAEPVLSPTAGAEASFPAFRPAAPVQSDPTRLGGSAVAPTRSPSRDRPKKGWRAAVSRLGLNPSKSKVEEDQDESTSIANSPLRRSRRVGFAGGKGGVGKSSLAIATGNKVASVRRKGNIVAVDLDRNGTLLQRVRDVTHNDSPSSLGAYAADPETIHDQRSSEHMMVSSDGLAVLGSSRVTQSPSLTSADLAVGLPKLASHYAMTLLDFGNSADSPVYLPALRTLDTLVLVTSDEADSVENIANLLDDIRDEGLSDLLSRTVLVINGRSKAKSSVDVEDLAKRFHSEHREVVRIPWDAHLSEGGPISLDRLDPKVDAQLLKLAAVVVNLSASAPM